MGSSEKRILIVTNFGHMMSHYNMFVFPSLVLPLTASLKLDLAQTLALPFWQYLLFGVTALPWGLAGDRVGGRVLMIVMFLGAGVSGMAAAIWVDSAWELSLALAGIGFFSGIYHPIGMGLISKGVKRLTVAMGYNAVFGGLGLVIAPLATGIFNWISGPRTAFLALGILNLIGLLLMLTFPLATAQTQMEKKQSDGENGRIGAFVVLLIAAGLAGLAFTGATVILPSYLELKGTQIFRTASAFWSGGLSSNLIATFVTSTVYAVGMMGQYIGGHAGERYDARLTYLVYHAACIPFAFLMAATQDFTLAGLSMVYFFCLLGNQPCENTLVARFTPERWHHSAFGLKFVLTFGVGSVAVEVAAWVQSVWGMEAIFTTLGFTSVCITAAILLLIAMSNRQAKAEISVNEMRAAV
ncbi:MAG: MFS transporter [Desulfomonilaceae bacterium]